MSKPKGIYGRVGTCGDCQYYNDAENRCWFTAEWNSRLTFDFDEACENFEERYID